VAKAKKNAVPETNQGRFAKAAAGCKSVFQGMRNELKRVHWPTRRELYSYSVIVFVVVIITTLLLWLFDQLISFLFGRII
jgi:preprotein translocase subunit SecE